MHTNIPACIHTCIHTYIHRLKWVTSSTDYVHTYIHTCMKTHTHKYIPTYLHIYIPTQVEVRSIIDRLRTLTSDNAELVPLPSKIPCQSQCMSARAVCTCKYVHIRLNVCVRMQNVCMPVYTCTTHVYMFFRWLSVYICLFWVQQTCFLFQNMVCRCSPVAIPIYVYT